MWFYRESFFNAGNVQEAVGNRWKDTEPLSEKEVG
jgi:hypothetical protein